MGQPIVSYESGQTPYPFEALTTTNNTDFVSTFSPWSNVAGSEPVVAPYGLLTGGALSGTSTDNQVAVTALTASMAGVSGADAFGVITVAGGTVLASRGAGATPFRITSVTVTDAGALAAVPGTAGGAFVATRGAAGGPPLIPVGSIEIGQIYLAAEADAPIISGQIYAVDGLHVERADYPVYQIDYARGQVTFATALPLIHTGPAPKKVYAKGSTPLFAPVPRASDWTPAESTYSINSADTYDGPVGSASSSLGQASFSAILRDGITDGFLAQKGKTLWFQFQPDRDKSLPKQLTQGILGISRSFPAGGGSFSASCTVTPSVESLDVRS